MNFHSPYYGVPNDCDAPVAKTDPLFDPQSEDVMDQADTISVSELEAEIEGSGIDPATCVDKFVSLNGDRFFVTKL